MLPTKRKVKNQGPELPKPEQVGLVLSADSTLWRWVEHKGFPALGGYRIQGVIEEESRYLGEGETARLAKEAMEWAREEARRLGLPTKGLLLRTERGSAFQSEAFCGYLCEHRIGQVFAPGGEAGRDRQG